VKDKGFKVASIKSELRPVTFPHALGHSLSEEEECVQKKILNKARLNPENWKTVVSWRFQLKLRSLSLVNESSFLASPKIFC
jgi:hypothetical protein